MQFQSPPPDLNLFGTDGIRATVGKAPFTSKELTQLGHALGLWACQRYSQQPRILLGHDTRHSCSWVKSALQTGLLRHPVIVYDADVLPTPALCKIIKDNNEFDCSIIISASHNPYHDNGIKIVNQAGKINREDELLISSLFRQEQLSDDYSLFGNVTWFTHAQALYQQALQRHFPSNFLHNKKVVLDCANGATTTSALAIFKLFGATVIPLHYQPNGININQACGTLHTQDLQQAIVAHQADIGFAFDGDGDRVIAVNRHGTPRDGDDIMALLLHHPLYADTPHIVSTIMSNQGFEVYVKNQHKQLIRTSVGDKYVAAQLAQDNLLLGGEQSGHIIMRDYLDTGDGIFTALRVMETLLLTNNWDMITFQRYPQILLNIPVTTKQDLTSPPLAALIAQSQSQLHSGRIVVRYSGTENLLRIMVEDDQLHHAQSIGTCLAQALQKQLSHV